MEQLVQEMVIHHLEVNNTKQQTRRQKGESGIAADSAAIEKEREADIELIWQGR